MEHFYTIDCETSAQIIEKKSKFIADVKKVESKQQVKQHLEEVQKKYYDARHHCYAYRMIENGQIIEKVSDDGEPSGTAGMPILTVLKQKNLVNLFVVVTRYFGGVLLGTGGLTRAYTEAAKVAIEKEKRIELMPGYEVRVTLEYANLASFEYYCRKYKIPLQKAEYGETIQIVLGLTDKEKEDLERKKANHECNILKMEVLQKKYIQKKVDI